MHPREDGTSCTMVSQQCLTERVGKLQWKYTGGQKYKTLCIILVIARMNVPMYAKRKIYVHSILLDYHDNVNKQLSEYISVEERFESHIAQKYKTPVLVS